MKRAAVGVALLLAVSACGDRPQAVRATTVEPPVPVPAPVVSAATPTPAALPRGCSRRAVACVSTRHRVAWLQESGRLAYGPVPMTLGRPSQPTPLGRFRVEWKDREHTSSIYGTDMAFSVFFATGGIAFHQGPLDEASHGCVHLSPAAAAAFFDALDRGDRVHVF